jgi:DNA-binding PadR family transcriptional regulator
MKPESENLPELSHLQFAILDALGSATMSGKNLRKSLAESGINKSGPAFYQLMARLEESKFVKGWYSQEIIDGQIIKERHYKITGLGIHALQETKYFYQNRMAGLGFQPSFA